MDMRVYSIFYLLQQDSIKHLSGNGQQRNPSSVGAGSEVAFLGEVDNLSFFPHSWYIIFFPYLAEERVE